MKKIHNQLHLYQLMFSRFAIFKESYHADQVLPNFTSMITFYLQEKSYAKAAKAHKKAKRKASVRIRILTVESYINPIMCW